MEDMDPEVPPVPKRNAGSRPRRRLSRGMYILPSLFTTANMAAGYFAILQVIHGSPAEPWHFDNAAKAIGVAFVLDGVDGSIARMTGTNSDFGRELDSLADVISFGVAPALLAWMWGFRDLSPSLPPELFGRLVQLGAIASFLFLIAGASRLARFNISHNPEPSNPGRSGQEIFRRYAHSRRRGGDRGSRPLFQRRTDRLLVDSHQLVVDAGRPGLSHGQHLALL